MKKLLFLILFILSASFSANAQNYADLFTVYTPATPQREYNKPLPSIIDNSVTVINSPNYMYAPSSSKSVTCTNSQKQSGEIVMIDLSTNKDSLVNAEILYKTFSNNTATVTITKLKLDGKWYPMNIEAITLSSLLNNSGENRNKLLDLMKKYNYMASSEDVLFLF